MVTNICYADDIVLFTTSEAEQQELVDRLNRVSRKYSLLVKIDRNKVMASDSIVCIFLIQNEQLEQLDSFCIVGFSLRNMMSVRPNSVSG